MLDTAWLMLLFPALGTLILAFFGRRIGRRVVGWLACGMVLLSFLTAVGVFATLVGLPAEERSHQIVLWSWMTTGAFHVDVALLIDQLSIIMALIVTGIGFLIHVYSIGYMHDDARYSRFFTFLNFFILMMLTLVLANNYLLMYVGWEGVGLASYLLIGFWFEKPAAADAGKKAFIVNRIGDFGLALAIMFIWTSFGTLNFVEVFEKAPTVWAVGASVATITTLLMLLAATGKSAQIPLFVWLPDAMEGPTPVSALIHAATMVTAGVYMLARSGALLSLAPTTQTWVAVIGALTALMAATIALTQTDLKRILAYSTISQLGFMFMAVGVGAYTAAIFHLMTHAFFKALLFLAAGSVMHALAGEIDIRKMGNLRAKLPTTYWTYLIGAAALAGIPLFSGFFSKDEILYYDWLTAPLLWLVGAITAALTAVYAFRSVFVPFWGQERDKKLFSHAHESPRIMTVPLIVLAIGAVLAGYLGLPRLSLFETWLEPVFHAKAPEALAGAGPEAVLSIPMVWVLLAVSGLIAIGGAYAAYRLYIVNTDVPARVRERLGWLVKLIENKYYFDWAYDKGIVGPLRQLSAWFADVADKRGIDGAVNGLAAATGWVGSQARRLQTGMVGIYALSILLGAVALLAWFAIR
ncbi:MAG: NADH-quinone oxidoreductase subunit L [Anaerolineae bacterium]|nr:NADH-quinone oxidoreductase subunit L [Anaerolineae bacterium]